MKAVELHGVGELCGQDLAEPQIAVDTHRALDGRPPRWSRVEAEVTA